MKKIYLFFFFIIISSSLINAQSDSTNIYDLSLEDLMNMEVKIITKKAVPIRENAAIITVISEQDIQNSGLRDLKSVLEFFVPGFQFGSDVEGAIGLSVRGMWAFEGKLLLMIDGLESNEEMFANLLFTNHYSVDNIKKIEISRGPGSAVYGGYAGLSVVNIITKNYDDNYMSSSYSQMSKSYAQRYTNLNLGKKINKFSFSVNGVYSQGTKSQSDNVDYYGNRMSMNGNSDINTTFINANIKYKGLNIRTIIDKYHYNQIDLWGKNYHTALDEHTDTYLGEIYYDIKLNPKHKITPRFVYKYQQPWNLDVPDEGYVNSKYISKYKAQLIHSWDITHKINLLSGIEFYNSALILPENHKKYEETFKTNTNKLEISNFSVYSQAIIQTNLVNITLGGRYDLSSEYGYSFVPRIAFTKVSKKFHFKTMLSQSFRIPGGIIPNRIPEGVNGIEPEKATNYEFEIGYTTPFLFLGINLFSSQFNKVIVYGSDPETGLGSYINSGSTGSNGFEIDFKYRRKNINFSTNYAFHSVTKSEVKTYIVPNHPKYFLAFTPHRINSMLNIRLYKNISFSVIGEYFGKRYGYINKVSGEDILKEFDPQIILNSNIKFNNIFKKNIYVTIGASNILDSEIIYIQPYLGEHAPIPGLSRSANLKILFKF